MKALIWKEWRENRLIVVWAFALMLVFLVGDLTFEISAHSPHIGEDELRQMIVFVWAVSALLCGSSMISPEIGSGSLQFLNVLPISRGRIWWIKLATGLCVLAVCSVTAWLTLCLFCWIAVASKLVEPSSYPYTPVDLMIFGALMVPLFAVGLLVSSLIDRTISALMASIVVAVVLAAAITQVMNLAQSLFQSEHGINVLAVEAFWTLLALGVPAALFAMSYIVFTRGETLRTAKRFRLLAGFLLPPVAIGMALVIAWFIIMA